MLERATWTLTRTGLGIAIALSAFTTLTGSPAMGETLPTIPSREVQVGIDTGALKAKGDPEPQILFSAPVTVPGATWLRLKFSHASLGGDAGATGAAIRIMSAEDGAVQFLNAESLKRWGNTSAYFNGDTVTVDVIGFPGNADTRLVIESAMAGETGYGSRSICGSSDDRQPSEDAATARLMPMGCSAFMINDANRMFLSAGHCGVSAGTVVQFNVPLSGPDGSIRHSSPLDQYPVDPASVQASDSSIGNDWAYFGVFPNSNTNLTPVQVQGEFYTMAPTVRPPGGSVRVTGYGITATPVSPTWNQAQKSHTGPYTARTGGVLQYQADTTGGNSGSAVIDAEGGMILGIHTDAGCDEPGSGNQGTGIDNANLRYALAHPRGVCASGVTPPGGGQATLYAVGDASNNFGTLSATGSFASVAQVMPLMQGLAYNRNSELFFAIDSVRGVYTINQQGTVVFEGTLTNTSQTINGLAYDPDTQKLYGIAQATGQLFRVSAVALTAAPLGVPHGGNIGGIDFDADNRVLYGINDTPQGSRLVRISTTDGSQHDIGPLGSSINDCNGLAWNPSDGRLYTVNAATQQLLVINPQTGTATSMGVSNGVFGAAYGLAARPGAAGNCTNDFDGDGDPSTDADIEAFFRTMAGSPCPNCGSTDIDGDGDASTDADIEAFFRAMAGHPC